LVRTPKALHLNSRIRKSTIWRRLLFRLVVAADGLGAFVLEQLRRLQKAVVQDERLAGVRADFDGGRRETDLVVRDRDRCANTRNIGQALRCRKARTARGIQSFDKSALAEAEQRWNQLLLYARPLDATVNPSWPASFAAMMDCLRQETDTAVGHRHDE
jgi:hypothetical protein